MANEKTLKQQNTWLVRAAVAAHIVAFACAALSPKLVALRGLKLLSRIDASAITGTVAVAGIAVTTLILLGAIPPTWRDRVIHWRWRHPLPGAVAFTEIGPRSSRIDMKVLEAKYGPLPTERGEQDQLFYKVYREWREEPGVLDAHRAYLAARDIGTINVLMLLSLPVIVNVVSGSVAATAMYAAFLTLAYATACVAAQNYGVRMVQNVLAAASTA